MKQLEAPRGTRVVRRMLFAGFEAGFFKRQCDGRVFYASIVNEHKVVFRVLADGSILRDAVFTERPRPKELISIMHPKNLNIVGIKWTEKSV